MLTELLPQRVSSSSELLTYLTYDDVLLLPAYSEITPPQTSLETHLTPSLALKIPFIASPMDTVCEQEMALALFQLGGIGIIHRNLSIEAQAEQMKCVVEAGGRAGAAVGVGPDFCERVEALIANGASLICLDSAHGHAKQVIEGTAYIKNTYPDVDLFSGNVCTYEGACALFKAGADVVKVGIGPGAICTTRIVAGVGAPQLSAVMACAEAAREHKKTLIADGGIKTSGDCVKALAAGASAVMLGSMLAGTDEAPAKVVEIDGKKYKEYRGMGSIAAMKKGSAARYGVNIAKLVAPQGVEGRVPYKGSLEDTVHLLAEGIRAGMAYLGARTPDELPARAHFIRQTAAGLQESHPSIEVV
jgi:IMP dehydrogenase